MDLAAPQRQPGYFSSWKSRDCIVYSYSHSISYCVTFAESEPYCHNIIPFCLSVCLDVCRSFRDHQPTTIDRSQPNLVGRYTVYTCPRTRVSLFGSHISHTFDARGKICKISPISNGSPLTRILATANMTHRTIGPMTCLVFSDRVSREGKAIGNVRPSVRLFQFYLLNLLTFCTCMCRDLSSPGLEVKVIGQG